MTRTYNNYNYQEVVTSLQAFWPSQCPDVFDNILPIPFGALAEASLADRKVMYRDTFCTKTRRICSRNDWSIPLGPARNMENYCIQR